MTTNTVIPIEKVRKVKFFDGSWCKTTYRPNIALCWVEVQYDAVKYVPEQIETPNIDDEDYKIAPGNQVPER